MKGPLLKNGRDAVALACGGAGGAARDGGRDNFLKFLRSKNL
jgi:hypothetical protein